MNLPQTLATLPTLAAALLAASSLGNGAAAETLVWRCTEAGDKSYYTNQEEETRGKNCVRVTRQVSVLPVLRPEDMPRSAGSPGARLPLGLPPPPANAGSTGGSRAGAFGSGFVVSPGGDILTNAHLIHECSGVRVRTGGIDQDMLKAAVVAEDRDNDLAVIRIERPWGRPASFRAAAPLQAGESVWVLGFPLTGLLSPELNVTQGIVSATAGVRGDPRKVQITNPVQTGNSGGPLLDRSGNVVGVVAGKLNSLKLAQMTGELPQNVNFAIKLETAVQFLSSAKVPFQRSGTRDPVESVDMVRDARSYTVLIECLGG